MNDAEKLYRECADKVDVVLLSLLYNLASRRLLCLATDQSLSSVEKGRLKFLTYTF